MKNTHNALFDKIREGKPVVGFSINYPNPSVIQNITGGWDFIWLDAQHGQMDYHDLLSCMIATDSVGIGTILRASGHQFDTLGPIADLNPSAIMIPMVNNREEAEEIAGHLHFAPLGHRSSWNTRMIAQAGKYCMFIAGDPDDAAELREMGADILVLGSDYEFLSTGAERALSGFRSKVTR